MKNKPIDKDLLKKYVDNPEFVAGIYNYCDRWCERCRAKSKCMNYAVSEEHLEETELGDVNNELFWEKMDETFQATIDLIYEVAENEGLNLDLEDDETTQKLDKERFEIAENHACSRLAKDYGRIVDDWFDSTQDQFQEKIEELHLKTRLELPGVDPIAEAGAFDDVMEIIKWYQYQIYVKLMRAVTSIQHEMEDPDDEYPKDSDGSAKVALIAIDRSIYAWGELRNLMPDQADNIIDILVQLGKLRDLTEKTFPNARSFIRPGLDL